MELKISKYLEKSSVNGPGIRFTIWFQGCSLECKGCFNSGLWDFNDGISVNIDEIINRIKNTGDIDGVTFSGGEPFLQAENLIKLSKMIKEEGLTILCYTGFTLEEILTGEDPFKKELLNWIDILIDGRYVKEIPSRINYIGSGNQKIHILNDKIMEMPFVENILNNTEITINDEGIVTITGFPDKEMQNIMEDQKG